MTVGWLTGLVTLPLAPVRATVWGAEQILAVAAEQYYDPAAIRGRLEEIDRLRDEAAIDEHAAQAEEEQLVQRLLEGRQRAKEGG